MRVEAVQVNATTNLLVDGGARSVGRVGGGPEAEAASFSGHESFALRYAWPKKCVDAVAR